MLLVYLEEFIARRQTSETKVLLLKIYVCRWKVIYGSVIRDMKHFPSKRGSVAVMLYL